MVGGRHPVGGEFDITELTDGGRSNVGDGFRHRHATGGRRIDQCQRGALTHRHGFTGFVERSGGGDGTIGHRHLPGANHLVSCHQTGNTAVTNGDQELFTGNSRQAQYPLCCISQRHILQVQLWQLQGLTLKAALHFGWFAKQHTHGQIHWFAFKMTIFNGQMVFSQGFTHNSIRGTFTAAELIKQFKAVWRNRQHITFLCLVTPDFQRAHTGFSIGNSTQIKQTAAFTILDQFRQGVGQTTGTHVMDKADGVFVTHTPAAIYHFLRPAFNFGVFTLYRGKVQIRTG